MVGWHHQLNGHEFEQTLGDGEGQGGLACCIPWGREELDTTEQQQFLLEVTQFSLVTQLCPTLCNRLDYSTPGFSVHHQLPELAQTHVHRVGDAIQPSHPLSSPSPAFSLS